VTRATARGVRVPAPAAGAPVRFFATAAAFRAWLRRNHAKADVLVVGFHHLASGRGGITYPQALDEALCFGWIDGVRHGLNATSYSIRFTPRRRGSIWSAVNLAHVARLEKAGRMTAAGRAVFAARDPAKARRYSFEVPIRALSPAFAARLAADAKAQAHFDAMTPSYRRTVVHWIMSAKQEATRERRFAALLDSSHRGRRVPPLDFPKRLRVVAPKPEPPAHEYRVPLRRPARAVPASRKA
jgi:uncharacterized protein YdeI (YjbR/CyaY-like superfamily)